MEISKEGEFSELPTEMLGMVLASDQLNCGEENVWEGLMTWVGDNQREVVEVIKMMDTVRFGLLEPDFLLERVHPIPLFESSGLASKVEKVLSSPSLIVSHYFTRPRCPQLSSGAGQDQNPCPPYRCQYMTRLLPPGGI